MLSYSLIHAVDVYSARVLDVHQADGCSLNVHVHHVTPVQFGQSVKIDLLHVRAQTVKKLWKFGSVILFIEKKMGFKLII